MQLDERELEGGWACKLLDILETGLVHQLCRVLPGHGFDSRLGKCVKYVLFLVAGPSVFPEPCCYNISSMGGPPTLDDILIIPHGAGKEYYGRGLGHSSQRQDEGRFGILAFSFLIVGSHAISPPQSLDLYEASVEELRDSLDTARFTSVGLVMDLFALQWTIGTFVRIDQFNLKGPELLAVVETKSSALAQAAEMDVERAPLEKKKRVARHSYSLEGQYCHASSFSLFNLVVPGDARVAKRPRKAGAIILGKANLSEFSHFRGCLAPDWSGGADNQRVHTVLVQIPFIPNYTQPLRKGTLAGKRIGVPIAQKGFPRLLVVSQRITPVSLMNTTD
ncbi:hypothetical protein ARMGADRAFT_1057221 [Armillaria gallica]|uniref:Uncharacterized protein n=1 Tax=Armillaria gallica TaxID=47427 RepID=A0A2H3EMT3_ARMGA|nr:hypothetical protein ARMGADRAFT_1057221 [Armillaria gallica]